MRNLTGIVASALILTGTAALAVENSATQTVNASVNESITISIDAATEAVNLIPGTVAQAIGDAALTVTSTNPFTITAKADTSTIKGADADKLFEFDTGVANAYVDTGRKLPTALVVGVTGTGGTSGAITTAGTLVYTGGSAVTDAPITVNLTQDVPAGVAKLPSGKVYRMVITYTAATTSV